MALVTKDSITLTVVFIIAGLATTFLTGMIFKARG